jgi:hypothetical protein
MILTCLLLIALAVLSVIASSYRRIAADTKQISKDILEEKRKLEHRYEALRNLYSDTLNKQRTVHLVCEQYSESGDKDYAQLIPIGVFSTAENAVEYIDILRLTQPKDVVGYAMNEFEIDKIDSDGDI